MALSVQSVTKTCNKCEATKPLSGFYKNKTYADGYQGHCKECQKKAVRNQERPRGWNSWYAMVQRCTNPNNDRWEHYGGRGISVSPRWRKFKNFIEDVGEPPPEPEDWDVAKRQSYWSLDRIDVNGHYEPGNVRWATRKQQANNRRTPEQIEADLARQQLRPAA